LTGAVSDGLAEAQLTLTVVFVGAGVDALDVGFGEVLWAAEGVSSVEDFADFDEHVGGGEDFFAGFADGEDAVVDEADDPGVFEMRGMELLDSVADASGERETGVDVVDHAGRDAAADDFVGEEPTGEGLAGLDGAENHIGGDGVRVADELHPGQAEQYGVKGSFNRGH